MTRDLTHELAAEELLAARKFALDLAASALPPSGEATARFTAEAAAVLAEWLLTGRAGGLRVQPLAVDDLQDVPQQGEGIDAVELLRSPFVNGDPREHERGQGLAIERAVSHSESPSVGRAPKLTDGAPASNGGGA